MSPKPPVDLAIGSTVWKQYSVPGGFEYVPLKIVGGTQHEWLVQIGGKTQGFPKRWREEIYHGRDVTFFLSERAYRDAEWFHLNHQNILNAVKNSASIDQLRRIAAILKENEG